MIEIRRTTNPRSHSLEEETGARLGGSRPLLPFGSALSLDTFCCWRLRDFLAFAAASWLRACVLQGHTLGMHSKTSHRDEGFGLRVHGQDSAHFSRVSLLSRWGPDSCYAPLVHLCFKAPWVCLQGQLKAYCLHPENFAERWSDRGDPFIQLNHLWKPNSTSLITRAVGMASNIGERWSSDV